MWPTRIFDASPSKKKTTRGALEGAAARDGDFMPGPRLCSNGTSRSLFIRLLHHFPWSGVASEELLLEAKGNPKSHFHIFSFWIVILPSGSFMIGFSHIYIEENAIPATLSMPGTSKDSRLEDSRHSCSWSEGLILMWGALGQV